MTLTIVNPINRETSPPLLWAVLDIIYRSLDTL